MTKIFVITVKWLEPATSCVRDQDATTVPAIWIFKLSPIHASMIMSFPEFTEFSQSSVPFRKNSHCFYQLLIRFKMKFLHDYHWERYKAKKFLILSVIYKDDHQTCLQLKKIYFIFMTLCRQNLHSHLKYSHISVFINCDSVFLWKWMSEVVTDILNFWKHNAKNTVNTQYEIAFTSFHQGIHIMKKW